MRARSLILLAVGFAVSMATIHAHDAAQNTEALHEMAAAARGLPVRNILKHRRIITKHIPSFSSAGSASDHSIQQQRSDLKRRAGIKQVGLRKVQQANKHRGNDLWEPIAILASASPDERSVDHESDSPSSADDSDCGSDSDEAEDNTDAEPAHSKHTDPASHKAAITGHGAKNVKGRVFIGQGTYYSMAGGITACGGEYTDADMVAALSGSLFDSSTPNGNPNGNSLCGKKLRASYRGKSITVTAVDRCEGCAFGDLDFTPTAFSRLSSLDAGRIDGIRWRWLN